VIFFQWQVKDRCLAVWSKDNKLYAAKVTEVHEPEKVCRVKYEEYDEVEALSWTKLCPVTDRYLPNDGRHHQNRLSRHRREEHWQVVICTACCFLYARILSLNCWHYFLSSKFKTVLLFTDRGSSRSNCWALTFWCWWQFGILFCAFYTSNCIFWSYATIY